MKILRPNKPTIGAKAFCRYSHQCIGVVEDVQKVNIQYTYVWIDTINKWELSGSMYFKDYVKLANETPAHDYLEIQKLIDQAPHLKEELKKILLTKKYQDEYDCGIL